MLEPLPQRRHGAGIIVEVPCMIPPDMLPMAPTVAPPRELGPPDKFNEFEYM